MANVARSEVQSARVARQPGKPKLGVPYRMHIIVPGGLVIQLDEIAERMSAEREGIAITRTDVARTAIFDYVKRAKEAMHDLTPLLPKKGGAK